MSKSEKQAKKLAISTSIATSSKQKATGTSSKLKLSGKPGQSDNNKQRVKSNKQQVVSSKLIRSKLIRSRPIRVLANKLKAGRCTGFRLKVMLS